MNKSEHITPVDSEIAHYAALHNIESFSHIPGVINFVSSLELPRKITSLEELKLQKDALNLAPISLITGTYDLIHMFHINAIKTVKAANPRNSIVVAVDTDEYTNSRKPGRPIQPYTIRAMTISLLDCVDYVIESTGDNAMLINALKPNIMMMSQATKEEPPETRLHDMSLVVENGGTVIVLPANHLTDQNIHHKISTSYTLECIKQHFSQAS